MNVPPWLQRWIPDRMTWIVGLGSTLGFATQTAGFWIVGAFVRAGRMDIQQASLLSTAEMVSIGVVVLALAPVIHRIPHKRTMLLALLLALVMQGLSAALPGFMPVLLTRIGSGLAFGVIYAVSTALGAAAADPQKAYAAAGTISLAIGTLWNISVGYATDHYGYVGVFVVLCLYCLLVGVPLLLILYATPAIATRRTAPGISAGDPTPLRWQPILGVMLIMALFAMMTNGVYIFIEQVAERAGLSGTQLGYGLTISSLVSALGVAGLGRFDTGALRKDSGSATRRAMPLAVSIIAIGLASWVFMLSRSSVQLYVSLTLWLIIYWAVYSYVLELAVAADPRGRVASAAGSALILLGGAGSALAGFTAKHFGMQTFGLVALAGCIAGAAIAIISSRALAQRTPA